MRTYTVLNLGLDVDSSSGDYSPQSAATLL